MHNFSKIHGFLHAVAIILIGSSGGQFNISLYRTSFDKFQIQKHAGSRRSCAWFGGNDVLTFPSTYGTSSCECTKKKNTFGLLNNVIGCFNFAKFIGEEGKI